MPFSNRQDYIIIDLIQQAVRNIKAQPLNLGGFSGAGGGEGKPPGGFIGQLIQTQVAYDFTEAATLATSISGSLLDNLNHIRYRVGQLELTSGIIVTDDNTPITYDPTTHIHFSGVGVIVTDLGDGEIRVIVASGVGGGGFTQEQIEDFVGNMVTDGNHIGGSIDYNDNGASAGTLDLNVTPRTVGSPQLFSRTVDPVGTDDFGSGYREGDIWLNTTSMRSFIMLDEGIDDGAVWKKLNHIAVQDFDGNPSIPFTETITFSGATITDLGNGNALVVVGSGGSSSLTVKEIDDSPIVTNVDTIVFSGISVEDLGSGDALAYIPTQRQGVATNLTFYPVGDGNFLDSGISYYGLYPEPHATATSVSSGTLTAANESVAASITAPGIPGTYNIGEGVYLFQIRARRLSGTENVKIKGRVYKRTSGGTETLLAETNETPNLTGSYANYTVSAVTTTWTVMSPSDFIVVKYVATPYDTGTDPTAQIEFNNSAGYTRVEIPSAVQTVPDLYTGHWQLRVETWTRTGNHTFTIAGDYTAIYRKGTRVRYRDGGSDEYGTVLSSTYSAPNTTVTLITNTDYTMAAATITNRYISYKDRPHGFPNSFTFAPSLTNLTVGDGTLASEFFPGVDSFIDFEIAFTFGSTSSITSAGVDFTPPAPSIDVGIRQPVGVCTFADTGVISYAGVLLSVSGTSFGTRALGAGATYTTQVAISSTIPFTWANTDTISIKGRYQY